MDMKLIVCIFAALTLLIAGCTGGEQPPIPPIQNQTPPIAQPEITNATLKGYCSDNMVSVSKCGDYIVTVSKLLGGGRTFYKGGEKIRCPVVSPQYISNECKLASAEASTCELEVQCPSAEPELPPAPPKPVNLCENFTSGMACTLQYIPTCVKVQKTSGEIDYRSASNGCVACSNLAEGEIALAIETTSCEEMNLKQYTLWDVGAHDTADACWFYAGNHLFDVTMYMGKHPGGPIEILSQCANNVTQTFAGATGPGNVPLISYLEENYIIGKIVDGEGKLHPEE
ncbi:hypothetical protein AUJ17_04760 [Candidatus Micrarchaeota archaeon CG1_02_47_40]|nr:MAG: hypothetical protein AUJ17_04760 [Candidatus Micrarchaeota archaeon CG1_02_47_40]